MSVRAYLGLGSNLGDRLGNLRRAVTMLAEAQRTSVVRSSRVYETEPVGGPSQPPYLNAVVEVATELEPHDLLDVCARIEGELGRVRTVRWGPRPIDVDILTYDRRTIDQADLVIPHPRMHERGFVLVPLAELDEDPMLPGGRRLADVPSAAGDVHPFAPPLEASA